MRHTGIRVGEFADLNLDCVREDNQGHHYLETFTPGMTATRRPDNPIFRNLSRGSGF